MSSKITNTEKNALLLKRVNNRPNALVTYGTGKLNGTETKDLFDKQFELVVERHNELCDDVEAVEQSFADHKQSVDEIIEEQNEAIEQKHTQQDEVINGLGQQVSDFDERVTDLEDRAAAGEFKGEAGRGIKSITTKYAAGNTSQIRPDDSEFIYTAAGAAAIRIPDGGYLWIKKIYTFTDNTTEEIVTPVRFGNTGKPGPKGDPFGVSKVYASIEEMNAGFATDGLPEGRFVMINTGNVEDADNAKVYVKGADGYSFMVDLSGSPGIKGDPGYTPVKGTDYYTEADKAELVQAVIDALPNGDEVSY